MICQDKTRFADFGPCRSALIISMLIAAVIFGLMVHQPMIPDAGKTKPKDADLKLYQTIVEQIHAGGNYYSIAGSEMRRMGFTTKSVFNWRLPLLAWLLGYLPSLKIGHFLAIVLALMTLMTWMTVFHYSRYTFSKILFGGLILSGPVIYSLLPGPLMLHEFWAGTLIALSLAANARGWLIASIVSGLIALFLRELSLPFVVVMMTLSYFEGKRREALLWFIGILAFGVELLFHWMIVSRLIMENDLALKGGWIVFGGWPFVLNTAQMQPYLLEAPSWLTAIILPFSLIGLAGWQGALGLRVTCTVVIYILAFLIVGLPMNKYWGLMYAFVMPLGLLHAPETLRELWQHIQRKPESRLQ